MNWAIILTVIIHGHVAIETIPIGPSMTACVTAKNALQADFDLFKGTGVHTPHSANVGFKRTVFVTCVARTEE